jgi:predicted nucleic acid-binding protein
LKTFSGVWKENNLPGILYDTSVYVAALRQGNATIFTQRRDEKSPLWLSAVVLEELYVGSQNRALKKLLAKFEKDFEKVNRLLVPIQTDWTICGQVLSCIGQKYGFDEVKKSRMTNDCLIAMTVARIGLTVITKNADDFRKINEFRPFNWVEV